MRVTADDYMTTDIIDEVYYRQDELRYLFLRLINRIVNLIKPDTSRGKYTIPFPSFINIIERNIDELSAGGYVSSEMQPTRDWQGELGDFHRLNFNDVNRWFETIELLTELVYAISYRGLITGNFSTGNDRTRQAIRSVG